MIKIIKITIFFFVLSSTLTLYSQSHSVKEKIMEIPFYFSSKQNSIQRSYLSNDNSIRELRDFIYGIDINKILSFEIVIHSSFSKTDNMIIMNQKRYESVKKYLYQNYPMISRYTIDKKTSSLDWIRLRQMIVDDYNTPYREKILDIIDEYPSSLRENKIKSLDNKRVAYNYLINNMIQYMPNVSLNIKYLDTLSRENKRDSIVARIDSLINKFDVFISYVEQRQKREDSLLEIRNRKKIRKKRIIDSDSSNVSHLNYSLNKSKKFSYDNNIYVALKTNLLSDVILVPNIELEIPTFKRHSINIEYYFPWYINTSKNYCYRFLSVGAEVRYWFPENWFPNNLRKMPNVNKKELEGFFAGAYSNLGKFDFQFGKDGFQSKGYSSIGLVGGYSLPLCTNLNMEFSLAIGYVYARYKCYSPIESFVVKKYDADLKYFGPTKLKIALVWSIDKNLVRRMERWIK